MAIASLPWYPFRGVRPHYDRFWVHLRDVLRERLDNVDVPDKLSPPEDFRTHWASPDLLLSQCCGYHIATKAQQLEVVAAPDFLLNDLSPGQYKSVLVTQRTEKRRSLADFQGRRVAYNEDQSYSGHTALLREIPPDLRCRDFFSHWVATGSHIESMKAVATGKADVAAIDAISFLFIVKDENDKELRKLKKQLRILKRTDSVQAPPFVTSCFRSPDQIDAIRDTLVTLSLNPKMKSVLNAMRMRTIVDATNEDYLPLAAKISDVSDMERTPGV